MSTQHGIRIVSGSFARTIPENLSISVNWSIRNKPFYWFFELPPQHIIRIVNGSFARTIPENLAISVNWSIRNKPFNSFLNCYKFILLSWLIYVNDCNSSFMNKQ